MSILQRIKEDQKEMRFQKAKLAPMPTSELLNHMIGSLTTLISDAERPGFDDGKRESTDAEVIQVVKKTIKGLEERLEAKHDLWCVHELNWLRDYLPKQFSEEELETLVEGFTIANPDAKMGQIMAHFKQNYDGQYDGRVLSGIVRSSLENR